MGWIRAVKGHGGLSDVKYKDGDEERYVIPCMTTDRLLIVTSQGRSFTVLADRITRGRGHGDPLSLLIDLGPEDHILHMAPYRGEGHQLLIVGTDHRGFRIEETDTLAQTKAGRQIYNCTDGATMRFCLPTTGDHVALIGQNRKLLIIPVDEIPTLSRGRGVVLQKYKDGGLSDLRFITLSAGLSWPAGERTRTETDLTPWLGRRGQVGRMPPTGFPRNNRF
jgi:topoisomerase-4 subunit A